VVDDDAMVREAYRSFFARQEEIILCGEARDGAEGVAAYAAQLPDLVLMDLQMPGVSGIEATSQICGRWPGARVVVMTTFGTSEHVVAALQAGACGYLLKDVGGPGLLEGLRQALAGDMPLSASVRRESRCRRGGGASDPAEAGGRRRLDAAGERAAGLLGPGLSNAAIGAQMYFSEGSAKQYLSNIGTKLGVKSRTAILIRAVQLNAVDLQTLPPVRPA
jgi:DNA-binding NarL/FixJ family response regulator